MTLSPLLSVSALSLLLGLTSFLSRCEGQLKTPHVLPYDLHHPVQRYTLQQKLTEVSGLALLPGNQALLVQDEKGELFFYNMNSKVVSRRLHFSKKGDFEDVQVAGDTAFVLRSDGVLFSVYPLSAKRPGVRYYDTGLSKRNNTEGLCYDSENHRLLIACKNRPGEEKNTERFRAVYSFDLGTKTLSDTPVVRIKINEVEKMADGRGISALHRIARYYEGERQHSFQPSGLAINPLTKELYILSSAGDMLAVLDSTSELTHAVHLSPRVFIQPEGIAFDPAGNLYITNEGRKGRGNILKFSILKK